MLHNDSDNSKLIKHLESRPGHKAVVHNRQFLVGYGALFFLIGLSSLLMFAGSIFPVDVMKTAVFSCLGFSFLILLAMAVFLYTPCSCNETSRLSHRGKRRLLDGMSVKSNVIGFSVLFAVIGSIGLSTFAGIEAFYLVVGVLLSFTGLGLMKYSLSKESVERYPLVTNEEAGLIESLDGSTEEDLEKMVDFYLKTGDFELADSASKKFLKLKENN